MRSRILTYLSTWSHRETKRLDYRIAPRYYARGINYSGVQASCGTALPDGTTARPDGTTARQIVRFYKGLRGRTPGRARRPARTGLIHFFGLSFSRITTFPETEVRTKVEHSDLSAPVRLLRQWDRFRSKGAETNTWAGFKPDREIA